MIFRETDTVFICKLKYGKLNVLCYFRYYRLKFFFPFIRTIFYELACIAWSCCWTRFLFFMERFQCKYRFSIAVILAVFKTDTNIFLKLFILLMMYGVMMVAFTYICKLVLSAYVQIGTAIAHQNNSSLTRIVSLVPLAILSYLFIPVIRILLRLICFFFKLLYCTLAVS